MFKLNLLPRMMNAVLVIVKTGNVLKIDSMEYEFTSLNDGDDIPAEAITNDLIVGDITKRNGVVNITIRVPYSNINAPESVRFPMPIMLVEDQVITFNDEADMENTISPIVELEPEE